MRFIQVLPVLLLAVMMAKGQRTMISSTCSCNDSARTANAIAIKYHKKKCLSSASEYYDKALSSSSVREVSSNEKNLILQFTPKLFTTASEPFGLKEVAAIIHPDAPWITYHLFWEDDIDFPDDNDPCDHELIWVRLNESKTQVRDCFTYFHGRILRAPEDVIKEANSKNRGPEVLVQWGKHGTMPATWKNLPIGVDPDDIEYLFMKKFIRNSNPVITLNEYNEAVYAKISTLGRRHIDSPLGRHWPKTFEGRFTDFIRFDKEVDLKTRFKNSENIAVSCLNNAVLNRYFLRYNFAPKPEWPEQICEDLQDGHNRK